MNVRPLFGWDVIRYYGLPLYIQKRYDDWTTLDPVTGRNLSLNLLNLIEAMTPLEKAIYMTNLDFFNEWRSYWEI